MMKIGETKLVIKKGDITKENVDVIVNAANSRLMGGGGVDGAIHRAGGPKILEECISICEKQEGCPTGEAVITSGGNLPAAKVVHAVGPRWRGGDHGEAELLRNAYLNSLRLAAEAGAKSIAFPSISTGIYGFPIEQAAAIAWQTVRDFVTKNSSFQEIRFILFSDNDLEVYKKTCHE